MRQGRPARLSGSPAPGPAAEQLPSLTWERVRSALEHDLFAGEWRLAAVLPPPKELASRYGVNYRTLRKALQALARSGAVHVHGRRYRPAVRVAGRSDIAVLVGRGADGERLLPLPPRGERYLRAAEAGCSRRGVRLVVSPYYYGPRRLVCDTDWNDRHNRIARQGTILGFIVLPTAMDEVVPGLLRSLVRFGVPVAILSEAAQAPRTEDPAPGAPVLTSWAVDSRAAGRAVARYLLALGHRRIAYICAQHHSDWSQRRLDGIREALRAAGAREALVELTLDRMSMGPDALSRVNAAAERSLLPYLRTTALQPFAALPPVVRQRLWQRVSTPVLTQLSWTMNEVIGPVRDLIPLAQQALADPTITAWVAGNTITALACHDLLLSSRVRVPQNVSLVGFDDSVDTATQRLTMFDFDAEGAVSACLSHVLGPSRARPARSMVDIPGYLITRLTTGPAGHSLVR